MDVLFQLTDKDFGIEPKEMKDYKLRIAARGIVMRDDGKIAIEHKINKNEYKLVGGGMEENENPQMAFKREVLEEAGCEVEIVEQLGTTEEYRSQKNLKQISHVFVGKVTKDTHVFNLDEEEKIEGSELVWLTPEEALKAIKDCYDVILPSEFDDIYTTRFVVLRDRKILEYYLSRGKKDEQ